MNTRFLTATLLLVLPFSAAAAEEDGSVTTIALTTTLDIAAPEPVTEGNDIANGLSPEQAKEEREREEQERAERARAEKERAEALLALLEAEATLQPGISVVERRHIELAFHELMLSGSAENKDGKLQLGKLATADLIVSVKLVKAANDEVMKALIRVTEPLTGVIRGATVVKIGNVDIADAAEQIVRYANAVIHNPKAAGVTVSIAPFESEGKFDHVLPLELMVRNVLTEQIRQAGDFQVLQRTDMSSLLDELDLVLSGFVDKDDLPETLPSREGAFHIDGTVDERIDKDNVVHMIVNARLVQTATAKVVSSATAEFRQEETAAALRAVTSRFVERLQHSQSFSPADGDSAFDEAQELLDLAARDVRRLPRTGISYGTSYVNLLRSRSFSGPAVSADSDVGRHLLEKTIGRLETALFLQPNNRAAQFSLAYCYSFHTPGIWNPERCNDLLRQIVQADKTSSTATHSYRHLMAMYRHHRGGQRIAEPDVPRLMEQVNFVLKHAPPESPFSFFLELRWLTDLYVRRSDFAGLLKTTRLAWNRVEQQDRLKPGFKPDVSAVAKALKAILTNSATSTAVQREARDLLDKWLLHSDPTFRTLALDNLPELAHTKQEVEQMRVAYAARIESMDGRLEWLSDRFLETAEYFLESDRANQALKLLSKLNAEKVWPKTRRPRRNGFRDYYKLLGKTYEALGKPQLARETYLRLAGLRRGSHIDPVVEQRIMELGGVPLRPDSHIDVQHHDFGAPGKHAQAMVTDGERLYCGKLSYGAQPGIWVFDLLTKTWTDFEKVPHYVTCLAVRRGTLWAGTREGIWKVDIISGRTQHFTRADGLPADNVVSIFAADAGAYAHVNAKGVSSGGIVQINEQGKVRYLGGDNEKELKPSKLIVIDGRPLTVSKSYIHEWNEKESCWSVYSDRRVYGKLLYANGRLWDASIRGSDRMFCLQEVSPGNQTFTKIVGYRSGGTNPNFLFDRGDYFWLAGRAWDFFRSHGLYRIHKETGQINFYGPRDGFSIRSFCDFTCHAGVSAQNRLWFAMTNGIAEVRILPTADAPPQKAESRADRRQELLLNTVTGLELRDDKGNDLWLNRDPLLRCRGTDQRFSHSECFLFNDRYGIPRAIAVPGLRAKGDLFLEISSVSDRPIRGSLPRVPSWRPGHGGSGRRLAKVQPQGIDRDPGEMMRVIAKSIRVEVGTRQWHRNALHPDTLFSYEAPKNGVEYGAVFVYGPENDPNVFVVIWRASEDQKWYWLAAPATSQRVRCSEKGEVVWQKDRYWAKQPTAEDGYREFKLTNHADLIESPSISSAQK